jgi:acetyl esterase/lipase
MARPSVGAQLFRAVVRLSGRKRVLASATALMAGIADARRQGPALPPRSLQRALRVDVGEVDGHCVYTLSPPGDATPPRVLYLHGGAFFRSITPTHWRFLRRLVETSGRSVRVLLYPLAPEHHGTAALDLVDRVFEDLGPHASVMGDSAGGTLALALALRRRDSGASPPSCVVLITPMLDAGLTSEDVVATARRDPMLDAPGLREAARLYAGTLPLDHSWVSPLRADLHGLPRTLLFAGTDDLLHHDALRFAAKAREQGVDLTCVLGEQMIHVWPILPFAEGRQALTTILTFLAANPPLLL